MSLLLQFFLSGLALGASVCALHMSILLGPVVARGCFGWRAGLRAWTLFSAGKVAVYGILGALAAGAGLHMHYLADSRILRTAGASVLFLIALWFLFSRGGCGRFIRTGSPVLLGLADGAFPCGPMLGFMIYLAYAGGGLVFGAASGALFGAGTVIGPALAVCMAAPYLWKKFSRLKRAGVLLRMAGAIIFFFWGFNLYTGL